MPFVPFPNTVKAEQVFLWDNQVVENVFHFEKDSAWSTVDMQDLAASLIDNWNDFWKANMATTLSMTTIKVTDLSSEFAPGIEYTTGLPLAGTSGGASMPNSVCVAVTWLTALRGRSYRGRTFHIGLLETQILDNQITVAAQGLLTLYYSTFITTINPTGAQLVVASRIEGGVERVTGLTTPVIGLKIDRVVDTQRRRLPGRGR